MKINEVEDQSQELSESIQKLFNYHIKENHLSSGYKVVLGQVALVVIAAAGFLYYSPAAAFADHENLGIDKNVQIKLNVVSTCYSACIVLCASTLFFHRFHVKPQQIPKELENIIEPPFTAAEYWRKNVIIGTAAALSAVPFATIAYMAYSSSLSNDELYSLIAYIYPANTFLHSLPTKLVLDDPFYGALLRYITKKMLQFFGWNEPQKVPLDQKTQNQSNALVNALNLRFMQMMNDLPNSQKHLNNIKNSSYEELIKNANSVANPASFSLTDQEAQIARIVGATLVVLSCIGYLANPILVFHQAGLAWWQVVLVSASPTIFLGVLFTYFGDTMGQKLWMDIKSGARYLNQCFAKDSAHPAVFLETPIFKLYPKIAFVCMTLNVCLAIFSAAAAMEMIHYAFANKVPEAALLTLYVIAQIGVSIVGVYAPLDYQKMLMTYYALYLEKGVEHDIIMFGEGINGLQGDCARLKPASQNLKKAYFDYAEEEIKAPSTGLAAWCASWCSRGQVDQAEAAQPLLSF
ncbi:MAG: hypothetical protein V4496_07730 [Pseudomonadota bacterium]